MTEASITAFGAIALALIGAVGLALNKIHTDVLPRIAELVADFRSLHEITALTRQQTEQNTARLNGQSAKIDKILLAAPPPVAFVAVSPAPSIPDKSIPASSASTDSNSAGTEGD
jgi:hypothetical protein